VTVREIHPKPVITPFPLDVKTGRVESLEFLNPEQMAAADRQLVEANEAEIARRAELQGFRLDAAGMEPGGAAWGYEQAVCPVFPNHVILEYSRSNGAGDVSLFSVVVPRGEGHVRVIPVRRRSYSLWTPAPANALTLNDFNHMVTEGHTGLTPDWLMTGLCYGALAGGHVRAALRAVLTADERYPLYAPAKLTIPEKGGAEVEFVSLAAPAKAMKWTLEFAPNGRLLKVHHSEASAVQERPAAGGVVEAKGTPVQGVIEVDRPAH
jgi:hypothetical protein